MCNRLELNSLISLHDNKLRRDRTLTTINCNEMKRKGNDNEIVMREISVMIKHTTRAVKITNTSEKHFSVTCDVKSMYYD